MVVRWLYGEELQAVGWGGRPWALATPTEATRAGVRLINEGLKHLPLQTRAIDWAFNNLKIYSVFNSTKQRELT